MKRPCLWPADDGSAKAIMVSFHQYRSQQQPADVALQLAIVDHLRQAESRHCYSWAPFFLSILGARTDTRERINQNMPDLTLYFDCDPGTDLENLERDLQQGLQQLGNVKAAETSRPATRITGLEILAAITLAVHVVHEARSIGGSSGSDRFRIFSTGSSGSDRFAAGGSSGSDRFRIFSTGSSGSDRFAVLGVRAI